MVIAEATVTMIAVIHVMVEHMLLTLARKAPTGARGGKRPTRLRTRVTSPTALQIERMVSAACRTVAAISPTLAQTPSPRSLL